MDYKAAFTVPSNTLASAPHTEDLILAIGTINKIYMLWPPGSVGMVHLQIYHLEHQLYPTTPGASYIGHDTEITIRDRYNLLDEPPRLTLVGWSPGTSYDHTVHVSFTLTPLHKGNLSGVTQLEIPPSWLE